MWANMTGHHRKICNRYAGPIGGAVVLPENNTKHTKPAMFTCEIDVHASHKEKWSFNITKNHSLWSHKTLNPCECTA